MWASLHNHSDMSLLDGLSKPEHLIKRAVDGNITALALSDHGTMAGIIKWQKARKKVIEEFTNLKEKSTEDSMKDLIDSKISAVKELKLINACELYIKVEEKVNSHLVVLAKNLAGYRSLVKIVSEGSRRENMWRKPRLSLEQISVINKSRDLIAFSGHCGSDLGNILFEHDNLKAAYGASTYDQVKSLVREDWKKQLYDKLDEYIQTFGRENFFLEIQLFDKDRLPAQQLITNTLRWLSKKENIPCVATCDSHYPSVERAEDQRILLCQSLGKTLPQIRKQIASDDDDVALGGFFRSNKYYLPYASEMISLHTEEEIKTSLDIANMCEDYNLASKPIIPKFDCPDGLSDDQYMQRLCDEGWKKKLSNLLEDKVPTYQTRLQYELGVLQRAGLSDYFLIVHDILDWTKKQGFLCGPGRGSSAGCLVSYLMGITSIDPIQYGLIFERFYDEGRNTKDKVSLPDIDCDIQGAARDSVIKYIKDKYGTERVGQIGNYGRYMGREALKSVLRAHEACSFEEMNRICSFLTDESAIADDLNEMKEEEGISSIIQWGLENNAKELAEWCYIAEDKSYQGPMAKFFQQAMRIEGTYKQKGKHAAGYVIYPTDLTDICPVNYTKDGDVEIAFDMHDVEWTGGTKIDILNVWVLDKIQDCSRTVENEFLLDYV